MPFNMFPYSNLHNFNLDWILGVVKTMATAVEAAAGTVADYAARLAAVETSVQEITPAAAGAVRHDVSQSLDAANRRRAATNIHAVSYDPQLLSADEQAQARTNIGAVSSGDIPPAQDAVLYTAQQLTEAQQGQARSNIAAASQSDMTAVQGGLQRTVRWDVQQLTDVQKAQARTNIGAISTEDIPPATSAVLYTAQELTDGQQNQARKNINSAELQPVVVINNSAQGVYTTSADFDEILSALTHNVPVWISMLPYGDSSEYLGTARLVNNGTGISATLTLTRQAADSLLQETWYNVSWLDGDPAPVLTVTTYQGRMVPNPTSNDTGKVLAVNSLGRPVWEDKGPLVVTFSGTTAGGSAACDKTWSEIQAALTAGRPLTLQYANSASTYQMLVETRSNRVAGHYTYIERPDNIGSGVYRSINCSLNGITNAVNVTYREYLPD